MLHYQQAAILPRRKLTNKTCLLYLHFHWDWVILAFSFWERERKNVWKQVYHSPSFLLHKKAIQESKIKKNTFFLTFISRYYCYAYNVMSFLYVLNIFCTCLFRIFKITYISIHLIYHIASQRWMIFATLS